MDERNKKRVYVRYCEGCLDKLRGIRITGTDRPAYTLIEQPDPPRPGTCPICFQYAHMGTYELIRTPRPKYRARSGGGERQRAGRAG